MPNLVVTNFMVNLKVAKSMSRYEIHHGALEKA